PTLFPYTTLFRSLYNQKENVLEPAVFANHEQLNSGTQTIVIDAKDNLWTGTSSDGLYKISHMDQSGVRHIQILGISSYPFFALEIIEGGGILCGTENDGLYQLNEQGELIHHYISSNKDD